MWLVHPQGLQPHPQKAGPRIPQVKVSLRLKPHWSRDQDGALTKHPRIGEWPEDLPAGTHCTLFLQAKAEHPLIRGK